MRQRTAHLRRRAPAPAPEIEERLDAVLLSHLHYDHLDLPSLRRLAAARVLAPRGAGPLLSGAGVGGVEEVEPGASKRVGEVEVTAVPAVHDDRRLPMGDARADPVGYLIDGGGLRTYFAGDTALFEGMGSLGPVDLALLPVAGWGPRLGPGHMDAADAARAAAMVEARVAVPIHWGTFSAIASRPGEWFSEPPREFAAQVAGLAPGVEVRVLEPGESTELP